MLLLQLEGEHLDGRIPIYLCSIVSPIGLEHILSARVGIMTVKVCLNNISKSFFSHLCHDRNRNRFARISIHELNFVSDTEILLIKHPPGLCFLPLEKILYHEGF